MELENSSLHQCVICRFPVELDDAVAPTVTGRCICLRCYAREADTVLTMDKALRRAIIAVLSDAEPIELV